MKKLSYHTVPSLHQIEYGFSIDKLTAQFLSKTEDIAPNKHFDSCIGQCLGQIKNSIMELAEKIRERINQYYSATNSVTHSSVFPLILHCQRSLEDLEKQFNSREAVRLKLEASTKDLFDLHTKIDEARAKASPPKDLKKLMGTPVSDRQVRRPATQARERLQSQLRRSHHQDEPETRRVREVLPLLSPPHPPI